MKCNIHSVKLAVCVDLISSWLWLGSIEYMLVVRNIHVLLKMCWLVTSGHKILSLRRDMKLSIDSPLRYELRDNTA